MQLNATTDRVAWDSSIKGERERFGANSLKLSATIDANVQKLVEMLIAGSNQQLGELRQLKPDPSKADGTAVEASSRGPSSVSSLVRELVKALNGQSGSRDVSQILSELQKAVSARDPKQASAGTKTLLTVIDQLKSALRNGPNKIDGSGAPRLANSDLDTTRGPLTPSDAGSTGALAQGLLGKLSDMIESGDKNSLKAVLSELGQLIASLIKKV